MNGKVCRNCGAELLLGAKYCSKCRSLAAPEAAVPSAEAGSCTSCGAKLLPGAEFCSKCRCQVNTAFNTSPVSPFAVSQAAAKTEKASKGAVIRTVIAGTVCLALLVLSVIFIPDRIRNARKEEEKDEFLVAEDTTSEEQAAEYDRINAAIEAGEYDNYEPETSEDGPEYFEKEFGPYEWMNYSE